MGHLSAERFLNYLLPNYAFLNFNLLSVRSLNFPKISTSFLIEPFFIIGDCVYIYYMDGSLTCFIRMVFLNFCCIFRNGQYVPHFFRIASKTQGFIQLFDNPRILLASIFSFDFGQRENSKYDCKIGRFQYNI